jgi:membrane protein DedA with SNARE-associated domain
VIPPVPADTFVLIGAFLSAAGRANPWMVFLVTWACNVASALGVYTVARHFGPTFFDTRAGRALLNPRQMDQIGRFYDRWGTAAVFGSRFLPAFRAMVPVFAGVTGVRLWRVAIPLSLASGLWYGALVYLGAAAGRNWQAITETFQQASGILLAVAGVLVIGFIAWWWRTRAPRG